MKYFNVKKISYFFVLYLFSSFFIFTESIYKENSTNYHHSEKCQQPTLENKLVLPVNNNIKNTTTVLTDRKDIKIPILMYHSINHKSINDLIISPAKFEKQIKWLKDNGFTSITFGQAYQIFITGETPPIKPVIITFDDGYEDNYKYAYPVLKKYNFKATIFMITSLIGKKGYLKENQLKDMYRDNIDIESHTVNHIELNKMNYAKQLYEITKSKEILERLLNKKVYYLCYPVGKYNDTTLRAAKLAGYKMCVTTKYGYAKLNNGLYTLCRIRISPDTNLKILNIEN